MCDLFNCSICGDPEMSLQLPVTSAGPLFQKIQHNLCMKLITTIA